MILDYTFVLDCSGSMQTTQLETEQGLNNLLDEQRKQAKNTTVLVSLVKFSNKIDPVFTARAINDLEPIKLIPSGMTALYDAVGQTIDAMGKRFTADPQPDRKVVLVILTDGQENSSHEYTAKQVAEMLKIQREQYSWDVVFIGAGDEAYKEGVTNFQYAQTAYINNTKSARSAALNMLSHTMSAGLGLAEAGFLPTADSFNYTKSERDYLATVD